MIYVGQPNSTSISDVENINSDFIINPNPATEEFSIQTKEIISAISIFDIYGKEQFHSQITSRINISNLTKGVYVICAFTSDNKTIIRKLIKQ
jgi:hypothetical protein